MTYSIPTTGDFVTKFVGREQELEQLRLLLKKKIASFVVIRGRRRIGKSRLIEEFGNTLPSHIIEGLPPTPGLTKRVQLDEFCAQVSASFGLPNIRVGSWGEAFQLLAKQCTQGPCLLALDEISWMGSKDPRFLAHLKNAWDRYFSKNPELILVVCGSVSSWIEANILSSTGFVGRISLDIHLHELPLREAAQFWEDSQGRVSPFEMFQVLAVTGGVPRYLEEIYPELTATENIRRLCFQKGGLLFREFDQIFTDLFSDRGSSYALILDALANRSRPFSEIVEIVPREREATLSQHLKDLVQAGFVSREPTWDLKKLTTSTLKKYRLSDNYVRFYLRYVKPQIEGIKQDRFVYTTLNSLPGWDGIMGLQFENLVLNNAPALFHAIHLDRGDIVRYGPFFQRPSVRKKGCQVDLLIQAKYRCLFLCEIKFSGEKLGTEVIAQMRNKQDKISLPRGWSTRSVLVHVNGITRDLQQAGVIDHIVNFGDLLS